MFVKLKYRDGAGEVLVPASHIETIRTASVGTEVGLASGAHLYVVNSPEEVAAAAANARRQELHPSFGKIEEALRGFMRLTYEVELPQHRNLTFIEIAVGELQLARQAAYEATRGTWEASTVED